MKGEVNKYREAKIFIQILFYSIRSQKIKWNESVGFCVKERERKNERNKETNEMIVK